MSRHDDQGRNAFAQVIRSARRKLEWTQDDLALESGVSRATLIRWETGGTKWPSADQLIAVVDALGLSRADVFASLGWLDEPERTHAQKSARLAMVLDEAQRLARELAEEEERVAEPTGS